MNHVMNHEGFDRWSENYDADVRASDEVEEYPFAAYQAILDKVEELVIAAPGKRVLDLGFGTGQLTQRLYSKGYQIDGLDFSAEMIAIAKERMPEASLIQADFAEGIPKVFEDVSWDSVVMTYSIHHLDLSAQVALIQSLMSRLNPGGSIVIGDVSTATETEMDAAKLKDADLWDEEESYIVVEVLERALPQYSMDFSRKSYCSGVLQIKAL